MKAVRLATPLFAVLLVAAVWQLAVSVFKVPAYVLPSPSQTWSALGDDWTNIRSLAAQTLYESAIGFLVGAGIGFALAVAMAHVKIAHRVLYPILIATQAVPIVAIAAPLVIILGYGLAPKLVIVGLIVFFPVVVNVLDGLSGIDAGMVNLARSMGAGPVKIFLLIRLPATLSPLFSALKLGAAYAVTGAVIGEWTASITPGLGKDLLLKNSRLDTAGVYADVLLLTAIGIGGFLLMTILERVATPWRTRSTARRWFRR
ncbi:ABC transporter permease [Actinoallomurus purpureus]|uniref:ABC transporter permease n=1 Tax=Actinoallomurus purpureus TaxID=478114 RepID=UPI002092EC93|nr:ABC transporter permease [Actinoallomurus purpureus]MCO6006938.1 ABC transporter permease [Actinoallomurus purpureus]